MDTTNGDQGSNPTPEPADAAPAAATPPVQATPADQNIPAQPAPTVPVQPAQTAPTAPTVPVQAPQNIQPNPYAAPIGQPNPYAAPAQQNAYAQPAQPNPYAHPAQQNPYTQPAQQNPYAAQAQHNAQQAHAAHQPQAPQQQPQYYAPPQTQNAQQAPQPANAAQPGPYDAVYAYQQAAYAYQTALSQHSASAQRRKRRAAFLITGAFATAAVFGVATAFGIAAATGEFAPQQTSSSANGGSSQSGSGLGGSGSSGQSGQGSQGGFSFGQGGNSFGGGSQGSDGSDSSTLPSATSAQEIGIVDINTQLGYDDAAAAGTGLVLTSNGEILTNNHVVEGSTSISVTVISTGKSYTAKVVGTDPTDDIAVLKLSNASGLRTANLDKSGSVSVGESVTGVGNAGGTGGTPSASAGTVTATNQSITTQAEESAKSETLHGLIETNADIQAGDSGGPLYNSSNQVVGIDTAASEGGTSTQGYAIPLSTALSIASQIEAGHASSTISIGYPAFLGIEVAADGSDGSADGQTQSVAGAAVAQVIPNTPAATAGLEAGDTITGLNGKAISSATDLTGALANYKPGQSVSVTWVDQNGASQTATVTLTQGPVA
jgi:S1-C subfamily serine protease